MLVSNSRKHLRDKAEHQQFQARITMRSFFLGGGGKKKNGMGGYGS